MQPNQYYRLQFTSNPHDNKLEFNYYVQNEDTKINFSPLTIFKPDEGYYDYKTESLFVIRYDPESLKSRTTNLEFFDKAIKDLRDTKQCHFGTNYDCLIGFNVCVTKYKVYINNFTTKKTNYLVEDLTKFLITIRDAIQADTDTIACENLDTYIKRREAEGFDLDSEYVFVMNQAFRKLFNKKIAKKFNAKYLGALMKFATI